MKRQALLLLAILGLALLGMGCGQSGPAGVYTCLRAGKTSARTGGEGERVFTFILEIRSNGTYVSTVESAIRGDYKGGEGDLPTGRGTWRIQDGSVVLFSGEREVARFLVEGYDLIDMTGIRYTRVRWLRGAAVSVLSLRAS
jgi:hypothetical protein